jgi:predicted enzyme related to lactoylglutathione lyase
MNVSAKSGLFPWYTLLSTDPEKAAHFYQNLFDWDLHELEGSAGEKSVIFSHVAGEFADLVFLPPPQKRRSHWILHLTVGDLEQTLNLVERCGGKTLQPAFDIPDYGRAALVADPTGATFMPCVPTNPAAAKCLMGSTPGSVCWAELTADDVRGAMAFYGKVAGWEFHPSAGDSESLDFFADGTALGSIRKVSPVSGLSPQWMLFFSTTDLENTLRTTELLGGKHQTGALKIPELGRFALIEDPTGALSYILQKNEG